MRSSLYLLLPALAAPGFASAEAPAERLHGYLIEDRFRSLETDEGAAGWIAEQEAKTTAFFEKLPGDEAKMTKRLDELSKIGGVTSVRTVGGRTFYVKRTGDQEQGILYVRDGSKERALVDPAKLDASGKVALDWYYPSPSGKLVAYGLSRDGTEESVLHVLHTDGKDGWKETIPDTRHSAVAWLKDESGFYYTRYPAGDRYNRKVYLHRQGADPATDAYVFGPDVGGLDKTDWTEVRISADGARVTFPVQKGWSVSELWLLDGEKPTKLLPASLNALFGDPMWIDGRIVIWTNHQAPKGKVVSIDPAAPAPSSWKTIIPEGEWPIGQVERAGGKLAVVRLVKAVAHLELYDLDGKNRSEVALPEPGSVGSLDGDAKGALVLSFTSPLRPSGAWSVDVKRGKLAEVAHVPAPKVAGLVVEQIDYPSYDGTWVPMYLVHRKDVKLDGSNRTLLTGYGGFNVSLDPRFSPSALYWVEQGGVFAVANLRGGAELGEAWHDAGKLGNKHQVFRDFEYAMRHLIRAGYTRPDKLAITGGSNGGLLMGAMMTQAPELFRASVGRVGLYDMIRFQRFPPAELWVDEYGSSENAEQVGYLLGYSPYHQVMPGVAYPSFLGLTAKADTRVSWIHTAKFVAALQAASSGTSPLLFHIEQKAGHGQGKGRSDRVKEEVMMFRFIDAQLAPSQVISGKAAAR